MSDWKKQIAGCFAGMPGPFMAPFAQHPNDERRAYSILGCMLDEHVKWSEATAAIRDYLTKQNINEDRIEEEMRRVSQRFEGWLD